MPTARTGLTGMTRVNLLDTDTSCLCFISSEGMQLRKRPAMEASLGIDVVSSFPSTYFAICSNVGQILKHNSRVLWSILNNALGEDMIVISSLPKPFPRKFLQVPLSRFRATLLKLATNAEDATFLLLPSLFPQEVAIGHHCWTLQPKIDPNHFTRRFTGGFRDTYNNVQGKLAFAITEIRATD